MDAMSEFFDYTIVTKCGFPSVTLEGTQDDWVKLKQNAQNLLNNRCSKDFAQRWGGSLIPLLEKIANEYKKRESDQEADEKFWNSMIKIGGQQGSGGKNWYNGWINILFPFIERKENPFIEPYSSNVGYALEDKNQGKYRGPAPHGVEGPSCGAFPDGISDVAVMWEYNGTKIPLRFRSGFLGATQDEVDGTLRPLVGWYIAKV